jgi:hypothetical protein
LLGSPEKVWTKIRIDTSYSSLRLKNHFAAVCWSVGQGKQESLVSGAQTKGENEDQRFRNAGDVFTRYPRPESSSGRYTKEELKALFPNAFSGKPGCVKGVKVHLDIDPAVKPVRQKLRPVPFHLREAISKEIKKQVEMGILERVEDDMKPPEWVANIVPVLKEKEVKMGRDQRMAKE